MVIAIIIYEEQRDTINSNQLYRLIDIYKLEIHIYVKITGSITRYTSDTRHYAGFLIFGNTLFKNIGLPFQRYVLHKVEWIVTLPFLYNQKKT